MPIGKEEIRRLREETGAGIMECKKVLEETGGDMAEAVSLLRERGAEAAKKREDRQAEEGRVFLAIDTVRAVLVRLLCETDFVARTDEFISLGEGCAKIAHDLENEGERENAMSERIAVAVGKLRENIVLSRVRSILATEGELLAGYLHEGGRIGSVVRISCGGDTEAGRCEQVQTLSGDLALHVAAFAPLYIDAGSVPADYLERTREELLEQARGLGKPPELVPSIAEGMLKRHLRRICLLDQGFVRDESITVAEAVRSVGEKLGIEIVVTGFLYDTVTASAGTRAREEHHHRV